MTAMIVLPLAGGMGIWYTQVINGLIAPAIIFFYAWAVGKKIPVRTDRYMLFREDFGVLSENRMELTIHTMEDVVKTSEAVMEFCTRHGIDKKRAYYSGLCMEEMAGNIVDHGFKKGKKHSVDIRVVYKEGDLMLRLRDDGIPFDPREREDLFDPEDITKNIGLRMISRIASSMEYQNMLGLNVLTMHV